MIHKSKAEVAASARAGSAVFQRAAAVTDVIIPQSIRPSLTYSHFIYPHSQNPCFTQVLCLWASFQGRSVETTQRLSRLGFETCSRLLARKPTVPMLSVEKKTTGRAWGWHGQTSTLCPFSLHPREKASYAVSFGGWPRFQISGAGCSKQAIEGTWCQCQPIALILCPALFVTCH